MTELVHVAFTQDEALDVRMSLNAAASAWGARAQAARETGDLIHAKACEHVRAELSRLWDKVHDAQLATSDLNREAFGAALKAEHELVVRPPS